MKKIIHILKSKQGNSCFHTAIVVLVLVMIFSVVLTYASLMTIVSTTKEDTQRVLDGFVIENATQIYQSIKKGNNSTTANEYNERFQALICVELGLDNSGTMLYNEAIDKEIIYYYTNPLTTNLKDDILELKTDFELIIPISFAGQKLFDLRIPLEVKSLYVLKY